MSQPFLRWAGGKRWFIESYSHLLPEKFELYYEPFLGGASTFFHLLPRLSRLSDLNSNLINAYRAIKEDYKKVEARLRLHAKQHSREHYYKVRAGMRGDLYSKAGDFIYLNRTCWNGLYRVNFKGEFNVPIGDRGSVIRNGDNFSLISEVLSKTELKACCFSDALAGVKKNDFCFIDPPYTVKHDYNGFVRYNENIFSWENQKALRNVVADVRASGGMALVLNANHDSIKKLYKGLGKIVPLRRNSMLAADSSYRGETKEIAIMIGYETK